MLLCMYHVFAMAECSGVQLRSLMLSCAAPDWTKACVRLKTPVLLWTVAA